MPKHAEPADQLRRFGVFSFQDGSRSVIVPDARTRIAVEHSCLRSMTASRHSGIHPSSVTISPKIGSSEPLVLLIHRPKIDHY